MPKKCPRLPANAQLKLTVLAIDVRESKRPLREERLVERDINLRNFLVPGFISHEDLKNSRSDYIEIYASAELSSS